VLTIIGSIPRTPRNGPVRALGVGWVPIAIAAALLLPGANAFSAEHESQAESGPEQVLAQHKCGECHAVDATGIGPSYKQIAERYKDQPGAAVRLKTRIRNGGSGAWGSVPMPPSPSIPSHELNEIANWILALK